MVVKLIIILLLLWLYGTVSFVLGVLIASTKLNHSLEFSSLQEYEVIVRFGQSKGFDKLIIVPAKSEQDAISKVLKQKFKYNNVVYDIYSIVSVHKINNTEDQYNA